MRPIARARSWLVVSASFAIVVVLLVLTNGSALYEARKVQATSNEIVENALASVQLVERMGGDIYRRHILVDEHILENERAGMARIEGQIAAVERDYEVAARAYEPLSTLPGEASAWKELQSDTAALTGLQGAVLALSRANQDAEAREALVLLEGPFAVIQRDVEQLVAINQREAHVALAKVEGMQTSSSGLFAGLALIAAVLTLAVGIWSTRLVRQREEAVGHYASLLEARNRELDAFAGRVAHDLRGPLTTIGMAVLALAERVPEASATTSLVRRGVARMEALIEDLLALSRIEGDAVGAVGDPALVAEQVREDLAQRLETEGVTLRVAVEHANARCAEGLLRQALSNLADNAIKYRRAGVESVIELGWRTFGQTYELRVSDNGVGMSHDEVRQAFDPFYRALRVRERPGTGLGLSIVRRVIEAHGGTVSVASDLDHGTTFIIVLRLASQQRSSRP
jgi:two-component system, OmpR family, sensor kinase